MRVQGSPGITCRATAGRPDLAETRTWPFPLTCHGGFTSAVEPDGAQPSPRKLLGVLTRSSRVAGSQGGTENRCGHPHRWRAAPPASWILGGVRCVSSCGLPLPSPCVNCFAQKPQAGSRERIKDKGVLVDTRALGKAGWGRRRGEVVVHETRGLGQDPEGERSRGCAQPDPASPPPPFLGGSVFWASLEAVVIVDGLAKPRAWEMLVFDVWGPARAQRELLGEWSLTASPRRDTARPQ